MFCDEMGLPLSKTVLRELREQLDQAEEMSAEELAAISRALTSAYYPTRVEDMDFSPERFQ